MGHRNLWWLLETHLRAQAFLNAEQIEINTSPAHFEGPAKTSDDPRDTPNCTQNKEERPSLTPRNSGLTREKDWGPPIGHKAGRVLFMNLNWEF